MPEPLQFTVLGQVVCVRQPPGLTQAHDVDASALVGAVNEATIGSATTAAKPIFLIASRRERPANLVVKFAASRFFSFSWSIASQIKSS